MGLFTRLPSVRLSEVGSKEQIIDVREPHEFSKAHLPNTRNIPLGKIADFESQKRVYVICASGMRSRQAVKVLRKKGIDAINIKGGMIGNGK